MIGTTKLGRDRTRRRMGCRVVGSLVSRGTPVGSYEMSVRTVCDTANDGSSIDDLGSTRQFFTE